MTNFTGQKNREKITFVVYYQGFLAVAGILVFFTKLDIYLTHKGFGMQLYWMIAFMLAAIPLFATIFKRLEYIPQSVLVWCGAYLACPLISILISSQIPDQQLLEEHFRTIIFFLLMLVIFSRYTCVLIWTKSAVFWVTIVNVLMYIYEFFNPTAFYLEQHASGRSSGLYENANTAAWALIIGMIFTIDLIKPKYRLFYVLFIFLGIATTFSRGAFASLGLVILLFILTKVIPRYNLPLLFLSGFMIVSVLSTQLNNLEHLETADGTNLFNADSLARIEFLLDPLGQEDASQDSRLTFVNEAWEKFARHPFVGNGLGAGADASHISAKGNAQRSHNIYLDLMVEYGFLGALIYPWLLLAIVWKVQRDFKKQAIIFVAFSLSSGFFSHMIIVSFNSLTFYALMANFVKLKLLEKSVK